MKISNLKRRFMVDFFLFWGGEHRLGSGGKEFFICTLFFCFLSCRCRSAIRIEVIAFSVW